MVTLGGQQPAEHSSDTLDAALARLVSAAGTGAQRFAGLAEAVCAHVADLKRAGEPPERVLSEVKARVHRSVYGRLPTGTYEELVERVVRWCIDGYYDASSGRAE